MPLIDKDNESQNIIHLCDLQKDVNKKLNENSSELIDILLKCYIDSVHKIKEREKKSYEYALSYIEKQREILNRYEKLIKERII